MRLPSRFGTPLIAAINLVLLVGAAVACGRPSDEGASADAAPRGQVVTVNGHGLYIECRGTGSPSVILDAGMGVASPTWDDVALATDGVGVRVCAYDRWGLGRSDADPKEMRPIGEATIDLHDLLTAAGVAPPYVLVSHSIAGLIHRDFTKRYPADVVGLVMVDTAPDDFDLYMKVNSFSWSGETLEIAAVSASLRAGDDLGHRPLVVIMANPNKQLGQLPPYRDYWVAAQHSLAARSTNSMLVVAVDSDHEIQTSQPGLVAAAIEMVVTAVTTDRPLAACAASQRLAQEGGRCDDAATRPPSAGRR